MTATSIAPAQHSLPFVLDEVEVVAVRRLSPAFVRLELASPALADFGVDGELFDQRIKLVFPHGDGPLPSFAGADESWLGTWLQRPVEERGHMRTYTVRDVVGRGAATRLVVDIVVHEPEPGHPVGPGCAFGQRAVVGDRLVLMAPKKGLPYGGIEFAPGTALADGRILLAGDETAVPAICAILEQLPPDSRGAAFLEVPSSADVLPVEHPVGVEVSWLPRDGAGHGVRLHAAVLAHLGRSVEAAAELVLPPVEEEEVDPDLWETPTYSSSGAELARADVPCEELPLGGLYAWIAGEAKVVTGLRRCLVNDFGVERSQVAFMGYWRRGVAMRS